MLSSTPDNCPRGIYSAQRPAEWYNKGCRITLRIAGVVGSRAVSHQVPRAPAQRPGSRLSIIIILFVISPYILSLSSWQEWVCHPDGCELVEFRFRYEALVGVLRRSPIGDRIHLPRLPYQKPRAREGECDVLGAC